MSPVPYQVHAPASGLVCFPSGFLNVMQSVRVFLCAPIVPRKVSAPDPGQDPSQGPAQKLAPATARKPVQAGRIGQSALGSLLCARPTHSVHWPVPRAARMARELVAVRSGVDVRTHGHLLSHL